MDVSSHDLLSGLRDAAAREAAGGNGAASIRRVVDEGWLAERRPDRLAWHLVRLAEANLPVARLAEGHVNALALLRRLGGPAVPGALYGVWGADGARPLVATGDRLAGTKRYASGLGIVERAIVTVGRDDATRLAVVDVRDARRHDHASWDMVGMQPSVSGTFVADGLRAEWLGAPADYFREPHFLGGVWRIAALQVGGTLGLVAAARDALAAAGRLGADAQVARLEPIASRGFAALALVLRAACVADGEAGERAPERAVALSIGARLLSEDLAQDAVAAVERSVGLGHFEAGSETGRIARDLATYCRQAARDAFQIRAGREILGTPGRLSDVLHG